MLTILFLLLFNAAIAQTPNDTLSNADTVIPTSDLVPLVSRDNTIELTTSRDKRAKAWINKDQDFLRLEILMRKASFETAIIMLDVKIKQAAWECEIARGEAFNGEMSKRHYEQRMLEDASHHRATHAYPDKIMEAQREVVQAAFKATSSGSTYRAAIQERDDLVNAYWQFAKDHRYEIDDLDILWPYPAAPPTVERVYLGELSGGAYYGKAFDNCP